MNAQQLLDSVPARDRQAELKAMFYPKTKQQLADENITKCWRVLRQ